MSRGLGRRQRLVLAALHALEKERPEQWGFYPREVLQEAFKLGGGANAIAVPSRRTYPAEAGDLDSGHADDVNQSRVITLLARRGLVRRGKKRSGPNVGVGLTDKGRLWAIVFYQEYRSR